MDTYNATLVNEWLCDQTSQPPAKAQLRRMAALLGWRGIADEVTKALRTLRRETNADLARQRCCFAKLQAGVNPFRQGKRRAPEAGQPSHDGVRHKDPENPDDVISVHGGRLRVRVGHRG